MPPLPSGTDHRAGADGRGRPLLDVVVPVRDEETDLEPCLRRLHVHQTESLPHPFRITVAENGSTDRTLEVARRVAAELPGIEVLALTRPGRGRALRTAWLRSDAPVLVCTDVGLSTDLAALLPLVAPLISGHSDLAVGTRLAPSSRVVRGLRREVVSRGYDLLLRRPLATSLSDAQCGFKAIRADVAAQLLPLDRLRATIGRGPLPDPPPGVPGSLAGQLLRFAAIGVVSTVAHLVLFLLLREVVAAQVANLVALLVTAVANTAANRRVTFGIRGTDGAGRDHLRGLAVLALALTLTSGSLGLLHAVVAAPSRAAELTVLVAANAAAVLLRFLLLRGWVFRRRRPTPAGDPTGPEPPPTRPGPEDAR